MNKQLQHNHTDVFLDSFDSGKLIQNAIVVDSGCGDGYASSQFINRGALKVLAHDVIPQISDYLKHPDISHVDKLYIIANQYDIVWSHHAIEHIDNPIEYLRGFSFLLKDSGWLWITCPNTANNPVYSDGHIHNFTIANLILCLNKAGFNVRDARWLINDGQLRVRVQCGGDGELPEPIYQYRKDNNHFNVNELPNKWRWNEE